MPITRPISRSEQVALLLILLLAFAVRIYALGRAPLWLDEQCQLSVAQTNSFEAYWRASGALGPIGRLSYLETWLAWHLGADTRAWLRLPSVLWGVGAVALTFELGRRWFSTSGGLLAAALLSVFGIHIQYSREARGYSLLVFLTLAFAIQLDGVIKRDLKRDLFLLGAAAILATQIHPVFWVPALALSAAMLSSLATNCTAFSGRSKWRSSLSVLIVLALSYALFAATRGDMGDLAPTVTVHTETLLSSLVLIYKALIGGYWGLPSTLIAAFTVLGIVRGLIDRNTRAAALNILAIAIGAALPVIVAYSKGMWIVSRYSLFAVPFFTLAAAHGMAVLARGFQISKPRIALGAVFLALGLFFGMLPQGRSPYDLERFKVSQPAWPSLDR